MDAPVLHIFNAQKRFGDVAALTGAYLHLNHGERLALLGPNGAGKTTLVRAIAGRVRLDDGRIALMGTNLDECTPAEAAQTRRKLGVVPQDIALYPLLTARENLRAFGELQRIDAAELTQAIEWTLDWTGLADRADEPVRRFSGGMKRRLNIACGVLHSPEVVLLDEPTVGVDPQSRERIWEMLEQLRQRGTSLLLTTHQLDEAQQVCDRIVIIDHGKAIADGTLDDLISQTVGRGRQVVLTLRDSIEAFENDLLTVENNLVRAQLDDVVATLPEVLRQVSEAGGAVTDITIQSPTLQAVFIHLTGRELRE